MTVLYKPYQSSVVSKSGINYSTQEWSVPVMSVHRP